MVWRLVIKLCMAWNDLPSRVKMAITSTIQLIKIRCTTWDLSGCPVWDGSADGSYIHLHKEVGEGRIRRQATEFDPKRLGEDALVPAGKTLRIPQALAVAQDPEHGKKQ